MSLPPLGGANKGICYLFSLPPARLPHMSPSKALPELLLVEEGQEPWSVILSPNSSPWASLPSGSDASVCLQCGRPGFDPRGGKIPLEEGVATPVLLPGESHGQRSLAGYSPQGRRVGHA